jgi:hypothetical protein
MAWKIQSAQTALDSAMPKVRKDRILTDGSLMLLDAVHSQGRSVGGVQTNSSFGVGVPTNGSALQNIAWEEAIAAIGSGDEGSTQPLIARTDGTGMTLERSAKLGLHGLISQSGNLAAGVGMEINMRSTMRTYLRTNAAHKYYFSVWKRLTRPANLVGTTRPATAVVQRTVASTSNYLMMFDQGYSLPNAAARLDVVEDPGVNDDTQPTFQAIGVNGWSGTPPANDAELRLNLMLWGAAGAYAALAGTNGPPSWILYRYYIEDLTVSGRSFDEIADIDHHLYEQAFATGGKYNGDSWTG